ncbi:MAG: hypothetical protein ACQEUT_01830 [Bacillota bacterium]
MTGWENNLPDVSNSFDQDYGTTQEISLKDNYFSTVDSFHSDTFNSNGNDVFHYSDPLKYSSQMEFKPLVLDSGSNTHFVKPHYVDPYIKKDGTLVDGYFRDGDGNTSTDTPLEQGGGYFRSNPDGNPFNNLK